MDIPNLIRKTRKQLNETQTQFGKRFDVTRTAIEGWEIGRRQAPYSVIEFVLERIIGNPEALVKRLAKLGCKYSVAWDEGGVFFYRGNCAGEVGKWVYRKWLVELAPGIIAERKEEAKFQEFERSLLNPNMTTSEKRR